MGSNVAVISWKEPWRAIQFAAEIPGVQIQLDREITPEHPLYGKAAHAIGRRIDNDDIVAVLNDGTYINVHLVWSRGPGTGALPSEYPSWFAYGTQEEFLRAMNADAAEYGDEA